MAVEILSDGRKLVTAPLSDDDVRQLEAGDVVVVRGIVYAARDAAHKRMIEELDEGQPLPFPPTGAIIYYTGPTPERPGNVIGSAGPTTASRMDKYTPRILEQGVKGLIGKGGRGPAIREELKKHNAVYMAALGGGGALSALTVRKQEVIAFPELGPESVRAVEFYDFPVWVVNDCQGRDFYEQSAAPYRKNDLLPEDLRIAIDTHDANGGG
jgi:fumarate hydratase subunit beta